MLLKNAGLTVLLIPIISCLFSLDTHAESGYDLWLRYVRVEDVSRLNQYRKDVTQIVVQGNSGTLTAILDELNRGLDGLLGKDIPAAESTTKDGAVVIGTPESSSIISRLGLELELNTLGREGYLIRSTRVSDKNVIVIASSGEIGALYGTFHFLRLIQTHKSLDSLNICEKPRIQRRLLNHWDNIIPDKYEWIERGYAGATLWKWDELPETVDPRYKDYARVCASIGINGAVLNNVNAHPKILRTDYIKKVAAIADALRPYGIRVYLSANLAAPMPPSATPDKRKKWGGIGNLDTADPLAPDVIAWWKHKVNEIYSYIPDFGGFLVKAGSEGMPGPQDYGRTHADGANMLANALAPYGGIVMWRAFVYTKSVDPDRAKRAYKEFVPLDGKFNGNVFVQVKNGPLDFQPREPFHPLFGVMPNTPLMMELQITQEYLGHSTHLVYLAPMWKEILDFDTCAKGKGSTVGKIIDGSLYNYSMTGIAGVANSGSDTNWCGHHFAQANWYAFGRLSWDHSLSSEEIADEWTRMTWSNDSEVVSTVKSMMLGSWKACVDYMTPLGLNFVVEADRHYDPNPAHRQGKYWIANSDGLGYDRTTHGSNAVSQYHAPVRDMWNGLASCPEDYLLWFHFVPWDYEMKSGRTLWEELCYKYYDGVQYVRDMKLKWQSLEDKIDNERFADVKNKLIAQELHAKKWRDTCVGFFQDFSGKPIPPYL